MQEPEPRGQRRSMNLTLCMEQTLGHRAHTRNIEAAMAAAATDVDIVRIVPGGRGRARLPWAFTASLDARSQVRARGQPDVTFFHTQSVGLFASQATRGRPYVVSLDATPHQVDLMGQWYRHRTAPAVIEAMKDRVYRHVLSHAAAVVAWSEWASEALVQEYNVQASKVQVVHPGASPEFFTIERVRGRGRPRVLFVGGDFDRKGGPLLLRAFERVQGRAELVVVSNASINAPAEVEVIADATPGSKRLLEAYASADIFCLPTLGDCTSVAIEEGMAAGLAVITTTLGSNPTTVADGRTGLLVAPGDEDQLADAISRLIEDADLRAQIGAAGREVAREQYDAHANARRLVALMESVA